MDNQLPAYWHNKPYYSLDAFCKNQYHEKCYKIALNAQMTCPNRDGTLGHRGCIFCSAGGSGDFAVNTAGLSIIEQLSKGLALFHTKKVGNRFIAYFQAYTNTYAPLSYLEKIYTQALSHEAICGISIATRPDCLPKEVLTLLTDLKNRFPKKFIWIELGLQTIHKKTAEFIRRGYDLSCYENAFFQLKELDIPVIVHVILGLPEETSKDIYQTILYLSYQKPFGIKLQLLHILKGTDLANLYLSGKIKVFTEEEYLEVLIHSLELLNPEIVIHRLTGDGPRNLLLAPNWSLQKHNVLNHLHQAMKQQHTFQGKLYLTETLEKR